MKVLIAIGTVMVPKLEIPFKKGYDFIQQKLKRLNLAV